MDLMVDYRDYAKVKSIFSNITIWSKYNTVGYHDASNEYKFSQLNTVFPDEQMNKRHYGTRYHKFKIYSLNGRKIPKHQKRKRTLPWRWPFIDVKYFKQNLTHVWNYDLKNQRYSPISELYPFHLRPYMGMWLPSPHNTTKYLKRQYGDIKCKENIWDHKREKKLEKKSSPPSL